MERLVLGLGNPGPEYEWTPHNFGFHVLDHLARRANLIFEPARRLSDWTGPQDFTFASDAQRAALLVKPHTWMNQSGAVAAPLVSRTGVPIERLMVVYDDIDLPLGALRIRPHGGAGGHRGVRSIIEHLGSDRFPRLRAGVGRPRTDAARHVLTRLAGEELQLFEIAVAEASDAIGEWLATGDLEQVMTRYHSRWNQGSGPQPPDPGGEETN